jgi:hypothetical protein
VRLSNTVWVTRSYIWVTAKTETFRLLSHFSCTVFSHLGKYSTNKIVDNSVILLVNLIGIQSQSHCGLVYSYSYCYVCCNPAGCSYGFRFYAFALLSHRSALCLSISVVKPKMSLYERERLSTLSWSTRDALPSSSIIYVMLQYR